MITLANIRDWLKSFGLFDNYYIGRLDTKKKNSLGVYNLQDTGRREVIGGLKKYEKKGVSLLIHGDTNKAKTEQKAFELYNALENIGDDKKRIGNKKVCFVELLNNEPIDVDQDADSVYEYVIEMNIYFEK
jgi:hypothetical protein